MKRKPTARDIPTLIRCGEKMRDLEMDLRDAGAIKQANRMKRDQQSLLHLIRCLTPVPPAVRSHWFASLPEGL